VPEPSRPIKAVAEYITSTVPVTGAPGGGDPTYSAADSGPAGVLILALQCMQEGNLTLDGKSGRHETPLPVDLSDSLDTITPHDGLNRFNWPSPAILISTCGLAKPLRSRGREDPIQILVGVRIGKLTRKDGTSGENVVINMMRRHA